MEANLQLDLNVLLPPRKRLLAGLKKQNSDGSYRFPSISDTRIPECVGLFLMNPNRSDEEIMEASQSALATAIKLAENKRIVAEEKAEAAAKAIAAAKDALEMSAIISEESRRRIRSMNMKKKMKKKKEVPVQTLYKNLNTDEALARKLHQAMNSSPRISKNSSPPSKSMRFINGNLVCNKNESDYKFVQLMLMDKPFYTSDDTCTNAEKRSRIEQKNVPLSICSSSKDDHMPITTTTTTTSINVVNLGDQSASKWKCREFKTSVCVKQDKAVESSS